MMFLKECGKRFIMLRMNSYLFIIFILLSSCNKNEQKNEYSFKDLDILKDTHISISKGSHQVVNAVAKKLLKDDIQIYLKADYSSTNKLRGKLYNAMSRDYDYIRISNLADQLHNDDGNIKAEFYNDSNILSSILYADSAQISNRYNNMIAKGHVVIYSPETNLMLLGDKVLWDNNAKRILSEDHVTIIKIVDQSQCIQQSHGFESDMNLSNYIFYDIQGKINEGCF